MSNQTAAAPTADPAASDPSQGRMPSGGDRSTTRRHRSALAAAYKALYTATGRWTAGIDEARLAADIFDGAPMGRIVPQYDAVIDDEAHTVSVAFDDALPPRIAVWRPLLGSTQLPIGAGFDAVGLVPRLPDDVVAPDLTDAPWPTGDADATAPGNDALDAVVERAFAPDHAYGGVTWGVAVVHHGRIVAERYDRGYDVGTSQRTNSAAKSIAATVVGAAAHQGLVDVDAPAPFPEWSRPGDPRRRITLDHLLRMVSGLYTEANGNPQQELYFGGAAAAERSLLNTVDSPPGTRWTYSGSDTILAVRAVREVLGDDASHLRFPFEQVLWKIGMTRTVLETDWNGDFLMSGDAWSTVRDMARLGLLYLHDGVWDGERLLPEGWPSYVATPGPAQPRMADGRGYGAQFWLYGPERGLPQGCYTAAGARGQYSMVVPDHDLVVVRRGFDLTPGFDIARFTADVIAALGG